jgi:hypothetical protein
MTAEEFEAGYAERSGLTVDALRRLGFVVRPCSCGETGCHGWQTMTTERAEAYDREHNGEERR